MEHPDPTLLRPGDAVLLVDRKEREYLKILKPGATIGVRGGRIGCDQVIGLPEGSRIRTSIGEPFLVVRPTYARLIPNLPRRAQVIYPKDTAMILLWGDIYPGATVLEAGVGPGALTIALLRAVGREGRVISIENREDFAEMARENVARFFGEAPHWELRIGDVYDEIADRDVDRLILDVSEPWRALDHAAAALRPGGVFTGYVPTALQVKQLADGLQEHPVFDAVQILENMVRFWEARGRSLRPEHRMVAHTAWITVARRIAPGEPSRGDIEGP